MYTVGHKYQPPPIHAGGLRYHGKAPSLSLLINKGYVSSVSYSQIDVFQAAKIFAMTEGMIPAPETAHIIKYTIDEALRCKKTGETKVILFNNSGHGLLDLQAYEAYLNGRLEEFEPTRIEPQRIVD
jgi:tryptophan synthase beta chain